MSGNEGLSYLGCESYARSEETVAIKDLPKGVATIVAQRYTKAKLTEARKTLDDKHVVYEIDLTNEKKKSKWP